MKNSYWAIPAMLLSYQLVAFADTVPSGTEIAVRTDQSVMLKDYDNGRIYTAHVDRDVLSRDGDVAIPRGAEAELIVRQVGAHEMVLDLESVTVRGQRYVLDATGDDIRSRDRAGVGANERTGKFVGGGALLGTIIGAIAGGGKGAAIGAVSGAAAGAGTQTLTRGTELRVPAESLVTFRLDRPLRIADWKDPGRTENGYHYHDERDNGFYR